MINVQFVDYIKVIAFWLCFTRWLAVLFSIPIFDEAFIPVMIKVLFCLVLSYALFPFVNETIVRDIHLMGEDSFWLLTIYYASTGLIVGYLVKIIMAIFIAAGSLIRQQVGFSTVAYFDPSLATQSGPIEHIIRWTLLIMIISSGALLPIFKGVLLSFESFSIYNLKFQNQSFYFLSDFFKGLIKTALLLSAPIIVTNLILNSILGIISRFVPQMNVFMISFVVNIGFGLLVLYFINDEFFYYGYQKYVEKLGEWFQFVV
ncbi:MAG: flagellar biosynthetic protein FliR [Halobacteriovoraceae bacterium]|nr:flagellar biosynthetic protein FliR [Halobacteriovoraceae bacterium]MCB9094199.1 flagellar biosynthetic protein FliR [Halobacteriovoraceae bacterium]